MIPLRDQHALQRRPWVTWIVLGVLIVGFLLQRLLGDALPELGLVPAGIGGWGMLALLTHALVHASGVHLVGNLLFLHVFGPGVEDALGRARFVVLLVLCAIAGGLAKILVDPQSMLPMQGASSAISGVLAAALVLGAARPVLTWVPYLIVVQLIEVPTGIFVVIWLVLQIALAYLALNTTVAVAPFAHLGGFLAGVGLAYALLPRPEIDVDEFEGET